MLVQQRLDRFVGSSSWQDTYRAVSMINIDHWGSDHSPILVEFWKRNTSLSTKRRHCGRMFIFEDYWNNYDECRHIVEREWLSSHSEGHCNLVSMFLQNANVV